MLVLLLSIIFQGVRDGCSGNVLYITHLSMRLKISISL